MNVDSDKLISITRLQKELTQTVRELAETGEPVYILKNNSMEAVLLSFEEYKNLVELEEMYEYFEIDQMISERLKKYDRKKNVSWESIRESK